MNDNTLKMSQAVQRNAPAKANLRSYVGEAATETAFQEVPRHTNSITADTLTSQQPPAQQGPLAPHAPAQASFVGFGTDTNSDHSEGDATVAASKAMSDALERGAGTLRMVLLQNTLENMRIRVKIGVPHKLHTSPMNPWEPMFVNSALLQSVLPPQLLSICSVEIVIGGLAVQESNLCTAVAWLNIQQKGSVEPILEVLPVLRDSPIVRPTTWSQIELPSKEAAFSAETIRPESVVHRSTSIELLARISAQIHDTHQPVQASDVPIDVTSEAPGLYVRLPPIRATNEKNNSKRLLVRHSYRDYAHEEPLLEELEWMESVVGSSEGYRPSNFFPTRLHETLHQIECEGHSDIIGWLPHGRSFKVFKQKEFLELVLPKYFVMTKKSSFLRQLNLYGYKRLCRVGSDQGSYYHELFLRGRKFLAKRMHRVKVNGNGIRTAGNPDDEPHFSNLPFLPSLDNSAEVGGLHIDTSQESKRHRVA